MSDSKAIEVAKDVASNMSWWDVMKVVSVDSIEYKVQPDVDLSPDPFVGTRKTIIVNADRRYVSDVGIGKSGNLHRIDYYFDGERSASLTFSRAGEGSSVVESVHIAKTLTMEGSSPEQAWPVPLNYFHINGLPLYETVIASNYLGRVERDGRGVERFAIPGARWAGKAQHIVYGFDSDSLDLRCVESFGQEPIDAGAPLWTWAASGDSYVRGIPLRSRLVKRRRDTGDELYTVESRTAVDFDAPRQTRFWPKIPAGVLVEDSIARRRYVMPGAEARGRGASRTEPGITTSAGDAGGGSEGAGVGDTFLWFGLALLALAGMIVARRRGADLARSMLGRDR